jgi:DNA-binding HxlR family transcriptional regulator
MTQVMRLESGEMLKRDYQGQNCSIARTLELVGERWSLLILRDVFRGLRRFDQLQENLGIATNILSSRLDRLVEAGILGRIRYQERPDRYEYALTDKGRELRVPLLALMHWGDRHLAPDGPPMLVSHDDCGGTLTAQLVCSDCGRLPVEAHLRSRPGPGSLALT